MATRTGGLRGVTLSLGLLLTAIPRAVLGQIPDSPLPGISVEIADFIQLPDTRDLGGQEQSEDGRVSDSLARINFMRELPDSSDRWFVNDLRGDLYLVDAATKSQQSYLNLRTEFPRFQYGPSGLSSGFLSVTPHPDFANNGRFYTLHSETHSGSPTPDFVAQGNAGNITGGSAKHVVLSEWTASDPTANTWSGAHEELLRIAAPSGFLHAHGDVAFNPVAMPGDDDYGLLYIGGGDYGYDAYGRGSPQAQRLDSIFGKILRIDPDGVNSDNGKYGIAAGNVWAADGDPSTRGEIYASGVRNAHRLIWDQHTGSMYTTDIGQANIEEINIVHNGANYGWAEREGTFEYLGGPVGPLPPNDQSFGFDYPVVQYDHGEGNAIAGGFVYRGTQIPDLFGKFVFGDIVNGRIFYSDVAEMDAADDGNPNTTAVIHELFLTRNGAPTTLEDLILAGRGTGSLPAGRHDLRFGQTSDGELYLMTKQDGWVRQLVGDPAPSQLIVSIDRATGQATLRNSSGSPVSVTGYTIGSSSGSLDPSSSGWSSLADQGFAGWSETTATAVELTEANDSSSIAFDDDEARSIGAPYNPVYSEFGTTGPEDVEFSYVDAGSQQIVTGVVEYTGLDFTNNLLLTIDPTTGLANLSNPSPFDVAFDGYTIESFAGSLRPADDDWESLADQQAPGWDEASATDNLLAELNPDSELMLQSGSTIPLGRLFQSGGEQDLSFRFLLSGEEDARLGAIRFLPAGLTGDYNDDGVVDAADYTVWRDHLGQTHQLPNEGSATPGEVTIEDYAVWRTQFGSTLQPAPVLETAAPEPTAVLSLGALVLPALATRYRRPRAGASDPI